MSTYTQVEKNGLFELSEQARTDLVSSKYYNEDLAPTSVSQRTWTTYNITMLWVGMSICIPSLSLASAAIALGLSPWMAVLNVALGNIIVLIPIQLNSNAGTKYGIPFPAFARMTFGVSGAHIPAISRSITACGWTAVQAWVGGGAIAALIGVFASSFTNQEWTMALPGNSAVQVGQLIGFLIFMAIIFIVAYTGMENIKWVQNVGGPLLIVVMVALFAWSVSYAGGAGYSMSDIMNSSNDTALLAENGGFTLVFLSCLTGNIAFWATMALSIPDFSRYARSQKDQLFGQMYGMPIPMAICAFIGAFFAQSTKLVDGAAMFDPTGVFYYVDNGFIVIIAAIGVMAATVTTCVAANVVAPANGFSNLSPSRISYKKGVIITCVLAIVMCPWWIYGAGAAYVFTWLNNYGSILAPIAAIFIADYFVVKKKNIDVASLYKGSDGKYWYNGGFNIAAIIAWIGSWFLPIWANLGSLGFPEAAAVLGNFGVWVAANGYIFSFAVGFGLYVLLTKVFTPASMTDEEHEAITQRA